MAVSRDSKNVDRSINVSKRYFWKGYLCDLRMMVFLSFGMKLPHVNSKNEK